MMRGKLSIEAVEKIRNCKSVQEVRDALDEYQPDCEERDAEILYKMFVLGEKDDEDMNGGCFLHGMDWKELEPFPPACPMNWNDPEVCPFYSLTKDIHD